MSPDDFIIHLFDRVATVMADVRKHPDAHLHPGEIVTLALLFALKGVGPRAFYRWLSNNYRGWFPGLPERTRLFRLFATHADWAERFFAQPTILGVADTYGIELRHPWREDRADQQIGGDPQGEGLSNHRWIVGAKLAYLVNQYGLIVAWDYGAANTPDNAFHDLIADFQEQSVILTDTAFHAATGDPLNHKVCKRGTWNVRMVVETVLSMLTTVWRLKKASQRTWAGLRARLAYTMALFNVLVLWDGIPVDDDGIIHLSIAEFGLQRH
ncbi:MAG: transposase [Chloroflexota bacterium]|nr:transposase [Chloroflexota bacterium]PLS77607.1 MAG: transposase [Chloroflexota bacterium]